MRQHAVMHPQDGLLGPRWRGQIAEQHTLDESQHAADEGDVSEVKPLLQNFADALIP